MPPQLPDPLVFRPRLVVRLNAATTTATMTLVSAPPGSGKTVLLASWVAQLGGEADVAWVSLEHEDAHSERFWPTLQAAVDAAAPLVAPSAARVGPALATSGRPLVVVLDDFQVIDDPSTLDEVLGLVRRPPPGLRLVISTRADPPLPLGRLRLSGALAEVRAADLAFDPAECRELLATSVPGLDDEIVERLCDETDGWAAALRFAALALEDRDDGHRLVSTIGSGSVAVSDYLATEVLDRQPRERLEFLLRTSVVDRFSPALAEVLTGREDAAAMLEELERANVFLTCQGRTYAYHALFREFLRVQLARRLPGEAHELHGRAARWFGVRGASAAALRHAALAGDWDAAARLVGDSAVLLRLALRHAVAALDWAGADRIVADAWLQLATSETAAASALVDALPEAALEEHRALALIAAATALERGDVSTADLLMRPVVTERADAPATPTDRLAAYVGLVRSRRSGRAHAAADYARALAEGVSPADPTEASRRLRALSMTGLGAAATALGDVERAELALDEALQLAEEDGPPVVVIDALSQLALVAISRGALRRAVSLAERATQLADAAQLEEGAAVAPAILALGVAAHQRGDTPTALAQLARAAEAARRAGDAALRVWASSFYAVALEAEGARGAERAPRRVRVALAESSAVDLPLWVDGMLRAAEPRVLAARGDLPAAWRALDKHAESVGACVDLTAVRARLELVEGRPWEALEATEPAFAGTLSAIHPAVAIELAVLDALARRELRHRDGMVASLERALNLAAPEGYRRPFLGAGAACRAALEDYASGSVAHGALAVELIALLDSRLPDGARSRAQLLEPLSARERAILRYLPTMMSNQEIAGELFVSVNTVKTHLRHVYRKLGVAKRREAVDAARRLDLL